MKRSTSFKKRVLRIFFNLKQEKKDPLVFQPIPIYDKKKFVGYLRVISVSSLKNSDEIKNLARWRRKNNFWFPTQFKVTEEGTKRWVENQLIKIKDRLLFMIEAPDGVSVGHMGLYRFDFSSCSCEIDNVVRGEKHLPGIMTPALRTLISWSFNILGVKTLYLKTYFDNKRAIALYKRCKFKEFKKIPMKKIKEQNVVHWEEQLDEINKKAERYHLQMILKHGERT